MDCAALILTADDRTVQTAHSEATLRGVTTLAGGILWLPQVRRPPIPAQKAPSVALESSDRTKRVSVLMKDR